jgi:hypothetical protein
MAAAFVVQAQAQAQLMWQLCFQWCKGAPTIDLPQHKVRVIKEVADGATGTVYLVHDAKNRPFALYDALNWCGSFPEVHFVMCSHDC